MLAFDVSRSFVLANHLKWLLASLDKGASSEAQAGTGPTDKA